MKKTILLIQILFSVFNINAQKAEEILSITQKCYEPSYYIQQAALWKNEINKNKKNAHAWYNYYRAKRYEWILSPKDTLMSENRFKSLNGIVDEMELNIPETYEYFITRWNNENHTEKYFPLLLKAHELRPNEILPLIDLATHYEMKRSQNKRDLYLQKWYKSGTYSAGLLNFGYNVLESLDKNAIILTFGDNDTYPLLMLQAIQKVRPDVLILNHSLLHEPKYRKAINQEIGSEIPDNQDKQMNIGETLKSLEVNHARRPVYVGLISYENEELKEFADKLYLVGLAYRYSHSKIDNIALLKKHFEKDFALDYLKINFCLDNYESQVKNINTNYLVPLITLYRHYNESGEIEKANQTKKTIQRIAQDGNLSDKISSYLQ